MPLTSIQTQVLRVLASRRNAESYVAGATPLNRNEIRYSSDIDVFHDREERVATSALGDAQILQSVGYTVTWVRQQPAIYTAKIESSTANTRLEWVADSDFRFFPTVPDDLFGYVLHPVDLAMNKVMAAAGRRAIRDLVDLVTIQKKVLPLGPIIWAAVDKAPGFTPEGLIAEIRRNSHYSSDAWTTLQTTLPLDPVAITRQLRVLLDYAEAFVSRMPSRLGGLLFLEGGRPVAPDPGHLDTYQTHAGQRRGHWPTSPEIAAAMFERYNDVP